MLHLICKHFGLNDLEGREHGVDELLRPHQHAWKRELMTRLGRSPSIGRVTGTGLWLIWWF